MAYKTKVQGTRFILELREENGSWMLYLMINNVKEEAMEIKRNNMRLIQEGVSEILRRGNANANPFQIEMMSKDLYKQSTGDNKMEKHKQSMRILEQKKKMMNDPSIHKNIVSEYKTVVDNSIPVKIEKKKVPKKIETKKKIFQKKKKEDSPVVVSINPIPVDMPEVSEDEKIEKAKHDPDMQSMMSEINTKVNKAELKKPEIAEKKVLGDTIQEASKRLTRQFDEFDTGVSSVDIEDLIKELNDTKFLLRQDIELINKRMDKMDAIIFKISKLSSKF